MIVYLRGDESLCHRLHPDVDRWTLKVDLPGTPTVGEIISHLGLDDLKIAFVIIDNRLRRLDYRPSEGEVILLKLSVSGG